MFFFFTIPVLWILLKSYWEGTCPTIQNGCQRHPYNHFWKFSKGQVFKRWIIRLSIFFIMNSSFPVIPRQFLCFKFCLVLVLLMIHTIWNCICLILNIFLRNNSNLIKATHIIKSILFCIKNKLCSLIL